MRKLILISLISTLLLNGCKKEERVEKTVLDIKLDNSVAENTLKTDNLSALSENGSVIQNAQPPQFEGDNTGLIQTVKKDYAENYNQENIDNFLETVKNCDNTSKLDKYLDAGMDINVFDKNGANAVSSAVVSGNMLSLNYLINKGANLNSTSNTGIPPLSLAVLHDNKPAIDLLLAQNSIDVYYIWGDIWIHSPLYTAVSSGSIYALEKFIKYGMDINYSYQEYGAVPLMVYAVSQYGKLKNKQYEEMITLLINNGIDINTQDADGITPFMYALKNNDIYACNALISSGADLSRKDNSGKDAIDYYKLYVKPVKEVDELKTKIEEALKQKNI